MPDTKVNPNNLHPDIGVLEIIYLKKVRITDSKKHPSENEPGLNDI